MNSKKVLLYTILFCIGAVSIGVFYGVTHLDKWKMREITKRAEEQRKLLAEQQALSLMKAQKTLQESNAELCKLMSNDKAKDTVRNAFTALKKEEEQRIAKQQALSLMRGQVTIQESNAELYKIIYSKKANDTVRSTFTALKKSGDLSEKEKNNIIDKHVEIIRHIETGEATGEDLINYRYSLYTLRNKLSKNPEKHKTELGKLNDLIADVNELDAKRNKKLKSDNAALTYLGKLKSTIRFKSSDLSEKEMYNIINKHIELSRRIKLGEASGEDLYNYRNSLYTLRNKLSKNPEKHKTELANLNDLIADVDELEAKRNKQFKTDGVVMTHGGELISF